MLLLARYPKVRPFPLFTVTEITCPDFEIVSVAAQKRSMITVSTQDLPQGLGQTIDQARLENNALRVDMSKADGSPVTLVFPGVPDLDVARLQTFQVALCGLEGSSVAAVWPLPRLKTPAPAGGRPR